MNLPPRELKDVSLIPAHEIAGNVPWEIHRVMQDAGNLHAAFTNAVENGVSPAEANPAAGVELVSWPPPSQARPTAC